MTEETTTKRTRKPRATTPKPETVKAEPAQKKETVQQLKNRLRNEAEREVLNENKQAVVAKTEAKYKEHGLEYVRRLTDEEKAQKEIEEHLQKYPQLREQFITQIVSPGGDDVQYQRGAVDDNGDALLAAGTGPQAYDPADGVREPWETAEAESRDAAEAELVEQREGE